jgi:undecaprenyl-diphosphatase
MSGILQWLNEADTQLFLALNGMHNDFFDTVMYWTSNRWIWIPFYAWIFFRLRNVDRKNIFRILVFAVLLIATSDQLSSGIVKKFAERLRPCHEAAIAEQVHLVNNYCGGKFGFVSSHASNCFALLAFLFFFLKGRDRRMMQFVWVWALIVSYSRIYLGVHYPGDIICGALLGMLLGKTFSVFYFRMQPG